MSKILVWNKTKPNNLKCIEKTTTIKKKLGFPTLIFCLTRYKKAKVKKKYLNSLRIMPFLTPRSHRRYMTWAVTTRGSMVCRARRSLTGATGIKSRSRGTMQRSQPRSRRAYQTDLRWLNIFSVNYYEYNLIWTGTVFEI